MGRAPGGRKCAAQRSLDRAPRGAPRRARPEWHRIPLSRILGHALPGRRVLVPGCGSGYEIRQFAERGDDVLGIDFSDAALERARKLALPARQADFFALDERPFDVVYERTFLCALPRHRWPAWSARMPMLVRPGGLLAGWCRC
ncbi:MAG TPA: methyltransferase domain-containing protein [Burkholderiales bacterium]|nr:methyltransferase domain-containing protein [Burkholderiales bacterium]